MQTLFCELEETINIRLLATTSSNFRRQKSLTDCSEVALTDSGFKWYIESHKFYSSKTWKSNQSVLYINSGEIEITRST